MTPDRDISFVAKTASSPDHNGSSIRVLMGTHVIIFVAGVVVGKLIDYDELQSYRSHYESTTTRIKRRAGQLGIAVLALGTFSVCFNIVYKFQKK